MNRRNFLKRIQLATLFPIVPIIVKAQNKEKQALTSNLLSRLHFDASFKSAWRSETINYKLKSIFSNTYDYNGVDFSVDNRWYDAVNDCFYCGSPYRKEVCPEDSLGTYQKVYFRLQHGVIIEVGDWPLYLDVSGFVVNGHLHNLKKNMDLYRLFDGDGEYTSKSFHHDISSCY